MAISLHETVVSLQQEVVELKATVQRQAERISELEEEVARLRGSRPGGIAVRALETGGSFVIQYWSSNTARQLHYSTSDAESE